jgi:N-acetylglucosamine-6-phosphate deacetylase
MRLGVEAAVVHGLLVPGDVEVAEGLIAGYGLPGPNGSGVAVPGFVDLQVNGFAGVDLMCADEDGYRRAGEALLETGVTAYLPTFISAPEEDVLAALGNVPSENRGARILGVHLEGPFLSKERLGIHPPPARRDPDPALLERLLGAGRVRMMTLAPELPGADELIDRLLLAGVAVSCGHTDATAEQAMRAFDRGARAVTHIFNAMRPFRHRDPGLAGAALAREDVIVQMILDGVHLAEETARVVWQAAAGRVALVTDSVAAATMGDGSYFLAGSEIEVRDGVARNLDDILAGSALTMIEAVRNLHGLGAPLPEAVAAATAVPARVLGEPDLGRLDVGLPADLVVLDDNLEIERVCVGGEDRVVA